MDYCAVGSKVNVHCSACERKITKVIKNITAESKIEFDRENDRVTVTGKLDPCKVIADLGKAGKTADLLWLHTLVPNPIPNANPNPNPNPNPNQNPDPNPNRTPDPDPNPPLNVVQSPLNYPDPVQMAQLHALSQVRNLNQVELINSKSIKMKFNGSETPKSQTHTTRKVVLDSDGSGHTTRKVVLDSDGSGHGHEPRDDIHHRHSHHHHFYRPSTSGGVPHEFFNGCEPPPSYSRQGIRPPPPPPPAAVRPGYSYPNLFPENNSPRDCKLM